MTAPLLLDLTHTSHTRARTGIQRVARALHTSLGGQATAICHDPYADEWRPLENWEEANLTATTGAAGKRGAQWPIGVRFRGLLRRWAKPSKFSDDPVTARLHPDLTRTARGLIVPEIFSPAVYAALPDLFAATAGPRIALFHDAIALKFPELSPPKTVARFPTYLRELLRFDGIAAISNNSRDSLLEFWRWLGVTEIPVVQTIPLGIDRVEPSESNGDEAPGKIPVLLCVGSIEGRKNHPALLDACEQLWAAGALFQLRLIGLSHPQTGRAALDRIEALQRAGRTIRYDGAVDDSTLEAAYAECLFTIYPSLMEGFGLPVLESVSRGKPCICSSRGALGESARGGGCLSMPVMDAPSLAAAIHFLFSSSGARSELVAAARTREYKTWAAYATQLTSWMETLPRGVRAKV